jgi:amino acid adenylation domain-containing protein/FkbM family methyltransferase
MLEQEQLEGYRLSPQQQHLWLSLPEAAAAARSQCSLSIEGPLDALRLRRALERLIGRHEILRTSFPLLSGMTVPLQVINEQSHLAWREVEMPAGVLSEQWVREQVEQERVSGFAYESGEVVHARLLRVGAEQAVLVLGVSGLCADGRSLQQLVAELWATYEAESTSGEQAEMVQYADFSEWQHELLEAEDKAAGRAYWTRLELAEVAEVTLGMEREPAAAYEPAVMVQELGVGVWEQVKKVARETAATEEEVLLAAWASLVWRLSAEQQEVVIGVGYSGRKYAELAEAVGLFNKFLPVQSVFAENATFAEVLGQVKTAYREAHRWQEYFSWEQHGWRTDSESGSLIGFTYDEWPASQSLRSITWSFTDLYSCTERLKLKLALVHTTEGLRLELHYDPSVYRAAHIERLTAEYETFLWSSLKNVTGTPVMRLALLGEAEQRMLLIDWNRTQAAYPDETTIPELFEEQVERQGATPAVIFEDQQLTFAELNRRANQLAHHLRSLGAGRESLIGICMERSVEAIIAVLGVLKAGAAYLPLDPQYPADRLSLMLEDGSVRVLISEPHLAAALRLHDTQVVSLLADAEILAKYSEANPEHIAGAENLAYVIYTSGSTGRPKGVMIEHRSVLNLRTALAQTVYRSHQAETLRVSVNAPMAFDASVKQIIQLLNGHTLCIIPEEIRRDGEALLRYLQRQRVEVLDATPSQMRLLLAAGLSASATALPRLVLVGGENIDSSLWGELAADDLRAYYNVYGPTECTVDATVCRISSEYEIPTIGRAVPNATLYVLDPGGQPVPVGIAGELHIGGAGVARGYLYRPELTAERFIPHPFSTEPGARLYKTGDLVRFLEDGRLEFLGRVDHQVKLRGYRVELGEIEAALTEHPSVREAVVMVREDEADDQRLVGYVVMQEQSDERSLHTLPNGMSIAQLNRSETHDLYEEIFEDEVYLKHGIELPDGACVFDVGANIGMFTLFVSQHCPGANIYAFEPIQPIFETLQVNAARYGQNVKLFQFGLAAEERTDTFAYYPQYSARSGLSAYADAADEVEVVKTFLRNKQKSGVAGAEGLLEAADELLEGLFTSETQQCRLKRLSDVIREERIEHIDLLKVDVQRAELDVLRGIAAEDWARIEQVVMEVHDAEGRETEGRVAKILELLERHGFAAVAEQDETLRGTDRYNLYASRRGLGEQAGQRRRTVRTDATSYQLQAAAVERSISVDELRSYLKGKLPDYMVPAAIVTLRQMPLTTNGKVNRRALPAPVEAEQPETTTTAGLTPLEEILTAIWSQVLKVKRIAAGDNFFEIGGHSLLATQLISRVREAFSVELPLRTLFEHPTIAALARQVEAALNAEGRLQMPPIRPVSRDTALPLSFSQQRLWFLDQLEPGSAVYNSPAAVKLSGSLDIKALERTLNEIVRRHEVLRTTFSVHDGEPVQQIHPFRSFPLSFTDLSHLAAAEREQEAQRLATAEAQRPFNLSTGPLLRSTLLGLSATEHILLLTMHHIVSDGWSMGVLIREVVALYEAYVAGRESPLAELPVQYADYAVWQRQWLQGEALEQQLNYWREQLAGAPPVLELPTDHPRPAIQSYRGARFPFTLSAEISAALKALSQQEGVTLFMSLLAAFNTLLHRYSQQSEIVVGTPIANRQRGETEALIGFFVNTLAMRTDLSGDPLFTELLKRMREVALEAYAHQDVPFEKLVEELQPERDMSRSPIFQVWFVLQDDPRKELALPGLQFSTIESESATTKFDLMLLMLETEDGLTGALEYNTDLFEAETIERMAGHFNTLLHDILRDPYQRISALRLLTSEQEQQLLAAWNCNSTSYPTGCPHELFAEQVRRHPEHIALSFGSEQVTYRELDQRANQLAHYIQSLGLGPEDLVALCLERSPDLIVAMLATVKAGAAYLPLEPNSPPERLAFILEDAAPALLLTQQSVLEKLAATTVPTFCLDREWEVVAELSCATPVHHAGPESLAYVIYTSGSTGQPKGVQVTHANVSRLFASTAELFQFSEADVWTMFHSAAFDFSVWEIWGALLHGGRLVLVPYLVSRSPAEFYELLCEERVTVLNQTPTAFAQLDEAESRDQSGRYLSLRLVIFGGEALEVGSLRGWFDRHGEEQPRLVNMYGITETTVHVTYRALGIADVERGVGSVIGRALPDLRLYVLDENQQLAPVGVAGELCVGGAGVARGYLRRAELTAERFVTERFGGWSGARMYRSGDLARYRADGELEYLGRKDNQVKIRGHRIELGEIEAALNEHGGIRQSVVVVRADESGAKQLVAYVVGSGEEPVSQSELRGRLRQRLPEYMLPAVVVQLSELPLTTNGKVARARLPEPESIDRKLSASSEAPQTVVEEILAGLWREVLELEEVGMEDNFFDLGGHSLLATRLISRVRESLNVEVGLQELFDAPTVRGLGSRVETALRRGAGVELPAIRRVSREHSREEQHWPLSFAQQRLWFLDQFEPGSAFYNIPAAVKLTGTLDLTALESTLNEIIRRHEILRTTFALVDDKPVQVINETQEISLTVTDLSDLSESEREEEVRSLALTEARQPFDLSCGPLLRANVLKLSPTEHVLLFTLHHIITDGWSMGVLIREVGALYEAYVAGETSPLQDLSIQYADFAAWQREWLQGEVLARQLEYWRKQLTGAPILELPTDRARPAVQTVNGAHERLIIPRELTAQLKKLSQQHGTTLFMTLLAAFQTLLMRYSGQNDVSVGTGIANRNREETEALIGFFVNTLVLRTDLSGNPSFRELLTRVREVALGAYAHQDVPFEKLVEELQPERDMSRSPLFQVMFVLQNASMELSEWTGLKLSRVEIDGETAKFDLMLTMEERGDTINGTLEYNTDLYERETIKRLGVHFSRLLAGIVADPEQRVWRLPLLSETEHQQLLRISNPEPSAYPREATIAELFEAQVRHQPQATALRFGEQQLCYREVNEAANQLARRLRAAGVGPESLVGVCLERSPQLVITLLAILKAGGAYLPLDVSYPPERVSFMLRDADVRVLVTQHSLLETLPEHSGTVICVDRDAVQIAREGNENLAVRGTAEQLAYVIYTSGSTGQPKGVSVSQRAVVRLVCATNYVQLGAGDRVGQVSNASFDALTFELWGALLNGAELVLVEQEVVLSAVALGRTVRAQGINVMFVTTALFNQLAHSGSDVFQGLKYLLFGGEAADVQAVREVLRVGGPAHLLHVYGPTENTTFSTFYEVEEVAAEARTVPIGRAIAQTEVYVLDQELQVVPAGVTGELYLGGDGLARGYLKRAELTAEKFVPHPYSEAGGARLYKTGDLVRCGVDGQIEFIGRIDHQVKIRGFRIELGEIEARLSEHEAVRESLVIARGSSSNEKQLVAYVVVHAGETLSGSELRSYLKQRLPDYMVPSFFVFLEALPLTANGKVDRRALPAPELDRETGFVAPRTALEELLAGLWAELLGVAEVSIDDDFFELGGHSLLATQLISRLRTEFGVEVALRQLFEGPTIAELAQHVDSALQAKRSLEVPTITPVSREIALPLSFAQQRLWFLDQLEPGKAFYNVPVAVRLLGTLNISALQQTLNEITRRHEVLRTTFDLVDGQPRQHIHSPSALPLRLMDLSSVPQSEREREAQRITQEEAERGFDLSHGPLLRATLIVLSPQDHIVLLTMHHIVSDGWSIGVLIREVAALYQAFASGAPSPLSDLTIQYADYAAWQHQWLQGARLEEQLAYWRAHLAGAPPVLELPTDQPRPAVPSYRGARHPFSLSAETTAGLKSLSRQQGATLFMTMLAAFNTLLHRYSQQSQVVVGTPIANRHQRETEELIGFFVNTLAVRTDLSGDPTFVELLTRVREAALGAYAHQDVPFEKVVEDLQPERDMSRSPLFQVWFVLHNDTSEELVLPELRFAPMENRNETAKYDLTLDVHESGENLRGILEYSTDLFEAETIERMARHFERLLEAIVAEPEQRLSTLPLLTAGEIRQQFVEWNDTASDYASYACLHELFEVQVKRTPDAVAVVHEGKLLSYDELNRKANQLAHHLQTLGVGPETLVGLCVERSLEMIVGLLGILKAGGAYLPLDPQYPQERISYMLEDAKASVVLTQQQVAKVLPEHAARVVYLDADWDTIQQQPEANVVSAVTPLNLAYVIYTSGSTGKPKGAMLPHRAVVNHNFAVAARYDLQATDRVLQFASLSFDVAVEEIFPSWLCGASVILRPEGLLDSDTALFEFLEHERITLVNLSTPYWNELIATRARTQAGGKLALRLAAIGGEKGLAEQFALAQQVVGTDVRLLNVYGPTETTVTNTAYEFDGEGNQLQGSVPIGRPLANNRIYLLDQKLQPVPVGVPGEVYIGGESLARGYLNRPELTAEKFVPDMFSGIEGARLYRSGDLARFLADGNIEFVGRVDQQVKVRGFRIELGEIEAVLVQHPSVREAVVLVREGERGDKRIVAYVVSVEGQQVSTSELRAHIKDKLPEHMVPSLFVMLDEMPLTVNGKVDRRALPALEAVRGAGTGEDFVAPRTPVEEVVAGIWSEVLGMEQVGAHDDFFDLGGHSLLATQVMSRIREAFQVEIALRELFEGSTVAELAQQVEAALNAERQLQIPPITPVSRASALPLSFAQQRLWFLDQLEPGSTFYNSPAAVKLSGSLDVTALERTLNEIVRRHEVLRTTFSVHDGEPVQQIHPFHSFPLLFTDLSHLAADERQQEAQRLATAEAKQPFNLSTGPLLRSTLLGLSATEHILLLTMHHIVSDGWSMGVLIREVVALYEAYVAGKESPLAELPVQYADYAVWQRQWLQGEALEQQLNYWRQQLAGAPPVLELPTDRPRPEVMTFRGGKYFVMFPTGLAEGLKDLSNREGATLFMTLLAGFQVLLRHYTQREDIIVGTDVANRNRAETEGLIGFFINQLVLRTDLTGDPGFTELLRRVREVALGAYMHQDLPFESVVDAVKPERNLKYPPLFQVKLTLQNAPEGELKLPNLALSQFEYEHETAAKLELTLLLTDEPGGLGTHFEYNADLFDEATISRMGRLFEAILAKVSLQPEISLSALEEMIAEMERAELLDKKKKRAQSNFSRLKSIKPKPVAKTEQLIKTSYPQGGETLPLVIEPAVNELDLVSWASANLHFIRTNLARHGALLFRGFMMNEAAEFERFAQTISPQLFKDNGEHPRKSVSGSIYTPVFYPPTDKILWHNENSFNYQWPTKIWFCCVQPAEQGGETPVVDSRKVFQLIDPEIKERFIRLGIMYVRNYGNGLGRHWQDIFQTQSRVEVEQVCSKSRMDFEWRDGDQLTTRAVRPAVVTHPQTGELTWFNQAQHWHVSCLDDATRDSMHSLFSEEELPRNCYYGDGSRIEDDEMEHILEIYQRLEVSLPWQSGDVMMLDNLLAAHARNKFAGVRRLLVAMGDMLSYGEVDALPQMITA